MIALVAVVCVVVSFSAGFVLGRSTASTPETRRLKQHARYTNRAALASRAGRHGQANVYVEAARELMRPQSNDLQ